MKYTIILVSSLFILLSSCANSSKIIAQENTKEISAIENGLLQAIQVKGEPIKSFRLQDRMKYYNVPGVSILVLKNGNVHWSKLYGVADANEGTELNEETLFQVASVAKPFTALGILKLFEKGRINLDVDVNEYLKDWQLAETEFSKKEVDSIRRILSHTAGLSGHGFDGYPQDGDFPSTIDVLNGAAASQAIVVDDLPGKNWRYSGGGYVILQRVIEDVTGMPFAKYMETEILKPLGMSNSTFQQPLDSNKYKNVSSAHNNQGEVVPGKWYNYPEAGAGGLWSTALDLAKYCKEIQEIYAGKRDGIISKKTLDMMFEKTLNDWGLGLHMMGEANDLMFGHEGMNEGFFADFRSFAKGDGVIVLTNGSTGNLTAEFLRSISSYYKWNSHLPRMIEELDISNEDLKKFTGRFDWLERPGYNIEIVIEEGRLHFVAPGFPTSVLTLYKDLKFIDTESQVEVVFTKSTDGHFNNLLWLGRFNFERIEE